MGLRHYLFGLQKISSKQILKKDRILESCVQFYQNYVEKQMDYKIENYKPDYKIEILTVWEKSVLETHHFLSQKDFSEIKEMLNNFDFNTLNVFCLIQNCKVIGFIALQDLKIEMLFLDPEFIGKGLGKVMLNYATSNLHANFVDVNEQNINATNFYEKFGFETYERTEKDDLGKNYPLLRMKLKNKSDENNVS